MLDPNPAVMEAIDSGQETAVFGGTPYRRFDENARSTGKHISDGLIRRMDEEDAERSYGATSGRNVAASRRQDVDRLRKFRYRFRLT